jgi:hypothetical protein
MAHISWNVTMEVTGGGPGACLASSALGTMGGKGSGRATASGEPHKVVPMSRPMPISPENGSSDYTVPVFRWTQVAPSTTHGFVKGYVVELDDDPDFASPDLSFQSSDSFLQPQYLTDTTFHWRVQAVYSRPWNLKGPWSDPFVFTYLNSPPVISPVPRVELLVDELLTVDLAPFIHDPDNGLDELKVECVHHACRGIDDLNLSLRYRDMEDPHEVPFTVRDGVNEVEGTIPVVVIKHKAPPSIRGIGTLRPPVKVEMDEGEVLWYTILVHDVDSTEFTFRTEGSWEGAVAHENGTLEVRSERGEVGTFTTTLVVEDESNLTGELDITFEVKNVEDPPGVPLIISPANNTTVAKDTPVTFRVRVSDPDIPFGQLLSVIFISNESGVLRTVTTTDVADYTTATLPEGEHRITVVVNDGQFSSEAWIKVTVVGIPDPPPVSGPQERDLLDPLVLAISLVLLVIGYMVGRRQHAAALRASHEEP